MTITTLPPASTWPAVVKVTVATDLKPGVSVAVANVALPSAPTVISSVAHDAVVSMLLSRLSCVVTTTLAAGVTDDGVRTFVMVSTCSVD